MLESAVKVQLHITPGLDQARDQLVHLHPVEHWNKEQTSFNVLLIGLTLLECVMEIHEVDDRKLEIYLELQGECWAIR